MGSEHTGSAVRIRKPKPIKDLNLASGHFSSLGVALVIESHQVQDPVDGEMRPMCPQRFILSARFERDEGRANHQLAQKGSPIGGQPSAGKRQHIGGLVLVPVTRVQAAAARLADDAHRQNVGTGPGSERRFSPLTQEPRARCPGAARGVAHIEFEPSAGNSQADS